MRKCIPGFILLLALASAMLQAQQLSLADSAIWYLKQVRGLQKNDSVLLENAVAAIHNIPPDSMPVNRIDAELKRMLPVIHRQNCLAVKFTVSSVLNSGKDIDLAINYNKKRSEGLLLNILPSQVAEELKQTGRCQTKTFSMVTVMFIDFKDFTKVSESVSGELLVDEINACFSAFDGIIQKHKVEKIKTIGDAYICAGGLPVLNQTHARDVIHAAMEIRDFMIARKKEKGSLNFPA